jgi:hypothetical protein
MKSKFQISNAPHPTPLPLGGEDEGEGGHVFNLSICH